MALIVNGEYVGDEQFFEEFRHLGGEPLEAESAEAQPGIEILQRTANERVVYRTLLRQMALQSDITVLPKEVEQERRRRWGSSTNTTCGIGVSQAIHADLQMERFCASLTRHVSRPTRMEVEQFYLANSEKFYQPERVHAAHIVRNIGAPAAELSALAALMSAQSELNAGKSFARVADRYSDCGGVGGSLGWIVRGEMVEEFDEVVFSLKKGERSGIFRTVFGHHIATVLDRKPAGVSPLEEIRLSLSRSLFEGRKQTAIERVVEQAMRRSQITVVPPQNGGEKVVV